jgi:hypothetical protein
LIHDASASLSEKDRNGQCENRVIISNKEVQCGNDQVIYGST